jgi:thiazole/oxazole-forming peptide maturase SagD family component
MQLSFNRHGRELCGGTGLLLKRMLSPLCGLDQRIVLSLLAEASPHMASIGAELTGVHVLLGLPPPPIGSYHIGGVGLSLDNAIVRTLGESVERYAQLTAAIYQEHIIRFTTRDALAAAGHRVLKTQQLVMFDAAQHARPNFPFTPFRPDMPIGWVEGSSLFGGDACWIPAQAAFVGYLARSHLGESRIVSGVTTGSAAHRTHDRALLNAILELVQIDCAMGHWFSSWPAHPVLFDERVEIVKEIIQKRAGIRGAPPEFFWIPSPDLPGFVIACMVRRQGGGLPAAAVGLGCSLRLAEALYKAWLEAVGVANLVVINLLQAETAKISMLAENEPEIYDLDTNVAWYAVGHGAERLHERFIDGKVMTAAALPDDVRMEPISAVDHLVGAFRNTGKDLYHWDLTPCDVSELGLVVDRVWSPDTLNISLPSAPPVLHPRFMDYGGVSHVQPHPYP